MKESLENIQPQQFKGKADQYGNNLTEFILNFDFNYFSNLTI